jgi:predicted RNA-binding Zn ribbon-like protein
VPTPSHRPSRFLFVGNHPALDFVNTMPMRDGRPHELLETYGDLVDWLREAGMLAPGAAAAAHERWGGTRPAARAVETARSLRASIRVAATQLQRGQPVPSAQLTSINTHLRTGGEWMEIVRVAGRLHLERRFEPEQVEDLLLPVARAAASLLCDADPALVKQCDGPSCVLFFYDETKNHARRWCSMRTCGNRAKAAAHYQRLHDRKARRP